MAQQIAAAVEADAKRQEEFVKGAYSEAENALAQAHSTLEHELEETKRLWEESERTADKTDPGYAELKKQYEDYMNYLNTQIQQANYQKQMVEYEQAQIKAQIESRNGMYESEDPASFEAVHIDLSIRKSWDNILCVFAFDPALYRIDASLAGAKFNGPTHWYTQEVYLLHHFEL